MWLKAPYGVTQPLVDRKGDENDILKMGFYVSEVTRATFSLEFMESKIPTIEKHRDAY